MNVGLKLVRIAMVYMMVGLIMGLTMAVTHDWTLMSVHSHILLLGWVSMAITGIVYIVEPRSAGRKLAKLHFWGHNVGLPAMTIGLAFDEYGYHAVEPLLGVGSVLVLLSLLSFVVNVFTVSGATPAQDRLAPTHGMET